MLDLTYEKTDRIEKLDNSTYMVLDTVLSIPFAWRKLAAFHQM